MREREIGSRQELKQEGQAPFPAGTGGSECNNSENILRLGALVLVCSLAATRARAQGDDLVTAAGDSNLVRAKALLDAKADVNARTGDGRTTLLFAAQGGRKEIVQLLKAAGAVGQ
jgi:ankyrin repeat protein